MQRKCVCERYRETDGVAEETEMENEREGGGRQERSRGRLGQKDAWGERHPRLWEMQCLCRPRGRKKRRCRDRANLYLALGSGLLFNLSQLLAHFFGDFLFVQHLAKHNIFSIEKLCW